MRLSAHDASFLYTETANGPMHGVTFSIIEGHVSLKQMLEYFAPRIASIPRLRQRVMFVPMNFAHPKWVDDPEFDLRNHVKQHDVPEGTTLQQAIAIGLKLAEPVLDRNRPLWLDYLLPNVEGNTVFVQMGHHAFVDGATSVAMSTVLTDAAPDAAPPESPQEAFAPPRLPTADELSREAMQEQAKAAADRLLNPDFSGFRPELVTELMSKGAGLMSRLARPVMQAPWNRSLVSPERAYAATTLSLDDIKAIRQKSGGTVNDVVVSVVAEAACQYMNTVGTVTAGQYLRLMCPVNVRDPDSDPLDMSGNHVSAMFPVLSAEPSDISTRFAEVKKELDDIKAKAEPETLVQLQQIQPTLPPVAMAMAPAVGTNLDPTALLAANPAQLTSPAGLRPPLAGTFNFTCTNVPGPTWTQYIAGHKVINHLGTLMLGGNLGMGVTVSSYDGKLNIGVTTDPTLMPEPQAMTANIDALFADWLNL